MVDDSPDRNGRDSHFRESGDLDGDIEKNEGKNQGPSEHVGFWDSSLSKVRKCVIIGWARTSKIDSQRAGGCLPDYTLALILMAFILGVLSLYWAVLYKVNDNLSALQVGIVDFDAQMSPYTDTEAMIGPMVVQFTEEQARSTAPHLGYVTRPPSQYNYDPIAVRQAVYDDHLWAAIIVNANATALLQQAVLTGNRSYDPLGAMQVIYNEARDQTTVSMYILPQLQTAIQGITAAFGEMWTRRVLSNETFDRATLSHVPQAISPGIGVSMFNLRPFGPTQATPAVTIGLIYLIIIAFFSFSFYLPIHSQFISPKGHPPMHFYQLIIWRWLATVLAYLFLSLSYSLVSLAFQIPFSWPTASDTEVAANPTAYHYGSFVVYWMLNFFGMIALGLASENATMFVGQPWTALWLIFWVITNVCTSFYEISLEPRFFYWGYAWPLHHIVEGSRTILFGLHSKIGLNFGVLIAWGAVNTAIFPIACTFMRWNTLKGEGQRPSLREILR